MDNSDLDRLCASQVAWFADYSRSLAGYMRSIGETGLNLTDDLKPPKQLYIEVSTHAT